MLQISQRLLLTFPIISDANWYGENVYLFLLQRVAMFHINGLFLMFFFSPFRSAANDI